VVGTTVGAVCGFLISYVADRYQLVRVPIDVYDIAWIPFTIEPVDFLVVVGAALLICLVATIYPARQASRLDPAEALRYQ
jgi:lipoprotein-releasing system permease protein